MAFDDGRAFAPATFNYVGIQRALHKKLGVFDAARISLEDAHKSFANHLALLLGVDDALQFVEEFICSIHMHQLDTQIALERFHYLVAFVLTHEPGVYIYAREVGANGAMHQRSGYG